jgi:hypothetical protein
VPNGDNPENPATELSELICGLSSSAAAERAKVAGEIFRRGRELARLAIAAWLKDETLAKLFITDASGFPEATVGVAVEPATFETIRQAFGAPPLAEVTPDQDAQEFELEFPGGVRLDILTSRDRAGSGAIARHLQKFAQSIQQVELRVKNVDAACAELQSRFRLTPVYPGTRPGANGTRINFFLVPASEGKKVLVELVEARTPA